MTTHEINGRNVHITRHAAERFLDLALDPTDIRECISHPENIAASRTYPGCTNYRHGRITLCTRLVDGVLTIITAVWSTKEAWDQDFALAPYTDREHRDTFGRRTT